MTAPNLDGRPTVPEVLKLVQEYIALPSNASGGHLHIVLADGNLKRRWIRECRERCVYWGDSQGARLCDQLLLLTMSQIRRLTRRIEWWPDLKR